MNCQCIFAKLTRTKTIFLAPDVLIFDWPQFGTNKLLLFQFIFNILFQCSMHTMSSVFTMHMFDNLHIPHMYLCSWGFSLDCVSNTKFKDLLSSIKKKKNIYCAVRTVSVGPESYRNVHDKPNTHAQCSSWANWKWKHSHLSKGLIIFSLLLRLFASL